MKTFTAACTYQQDYLFSKRCRKVQNTHIKHIFTARIPDPKPDEFPLVFTVKEYGTRQPDVTDYEHIRKDVKDFKIWDTPIRRFKNHFYRPLRFQWGAVEGSILKGISYRDADGAIIKDCSCLQDKLNSEFSFPYNLNPSFVMDRTFHGYNTEKELCDTYPEIQLKDNDKVKQVAKCVRFLANNYLIFRGEIWRRCNEPRYTYTKFGLNGDGTGFFIEYPDKGCDRYYFSALERGKAIDTVKRIALRFNDDTKGIVNSKQNIIVHRPEFVTPVCKKNTYPIHEMNVW